MADDAIDHGTDRTAALRELDERLERIYAGAPCANAVDRAFADVVARFAIPKAFPAALFEGFAWDAVNRRYDDVSELEAYAVRVAGTVGVMMALIMGVRDPDMLARACDLGVAMQLTNIARDVGEDARAGRLYLPLAWLRDAHIDPDQWLADPIWSPELAQVIERLLATADVLYRRSEAGLDQLPAGCRPGMYAARFLYAEIGYEVARRAFDSVSQRAVVPAHRKASGLVRAVIAATGSRRAAGAPKPLAAAAFLWTALPSRPELARLPVDTPRARWPRVEDRVVWVIDLFEKLERRERQATRVMSGATRAIN